MFFSFFTNQIQATVMYNFISNGIYLPMLFSGKFAIHNFLHIEHMIHKTTVTQEQVTIMTWYFLLNL